MPEAPALSPHGRVPDRRILEKLSDDDLNGVIARFGPRLAY